MQNLNVRLTLAIYGVAIIVLIAVAIVFRLTYFGVVNQHQAETVRQAERFVQHPDFDQALSAMSEDLAQSFSSVREQGALTTEFVTTVRRWLVLLVILIFIAISPLVISLSLFVSRRLTRPLKRVAESSRLLAEGDFTVRATPDLTSWDSYSLALAQDFNSMAASLEQLNNERQSMIADIAHELRTPLTAMQLQLEALQDGIEPLTAEVINGLYDETKLLSHIIQDLRTLSLAEARQLSLDVEAVDMHHLVKRTMHSFQPVAQEKGIVLCVEGEGNIIMNADAARFRQILSNLLSNALRYTPQGGQVTVKLERDHDIIKMRVTDTGKGLSEEDLTRVFNRFYRSDFGRVRTEGGSGLGLAIVKALVELHEGSITASNRPEGGAMFTMIFQQSS